MQHSPAAEYIRNARVNIRLATEICGTADLAGLQRALNLLKATLREMSLAEAKLRTAALNERAQLQREAALLKRELACLMRVIDGCAALHRGLGIRLSCSALTYSPHSCSSHSCSPRSSSLAPTVSAAAYEMQG